MCKYYIKDLNDLSSDSSDKRAADLSYYPPDDDDGSVEDDADPDGKKMNPGIIERLERRFYN